MNKDFNYYSNLYKGDKGDVFPTGNHYAKYYDKFLSPLRQSVTNICEIGIWNGASLKTFQDYFPNSQIVGLDIVDKSEFNNSRITTQILDQGNKTHLDKFVTQCKKSNIKFDIILDDGSHDVAHQQITFGKLFPILKPGGIYILEDLGSSYFKPGQRLYGYTQTDLKLENNTIKFLNNRPFNSPWISSNDLEYINKNVDYISIFDKINPLPYSNQFRCINNCPIRSITSIIQKK
jgi:hypothetical protein